MSYKDEGFWQAYEEFVKESLPRHEAAVDLLYYNGRNYFDEDVLLDLGCGKSNEAHRLIDAWSCMEVDSNDVGAMYQLDYRTQLPEIINKTKLFEPTIVSSLFSIEITAPAEDNYKLYETLFNEVKSLKTGLVSGFYYTDKMNENPVEEVGGLKSYQTLDLMSEHKLFSEKRLYVPAPSKLFGPNVIEVWKLLERK